MADISKVTKLPEVSKPPLQRWQQLPLRPKTKENSPCRTKTPKTMRSVHSSKTPKSTGKPKTPVHGIPASRTSKTPKSTGKQKTPSGCRFLPSRGQNGEYSSYLLLKGDTVANEGVTDSENDTEDEHDENYNPIQGTTTGCEYNSALLSAACAGVVPRGVLTYRNATPAHQSSFLNYTANSGIGSASISRSLLRESHKKKERRKVSSAAERILDAPSLMNDYYLNVLDWGHNDVLAVALGPSVYLWNATEATVSQLVQLPEDEDLYVSSVSWSETGKYLAVGVSNGDIQLWDIAKEKKVRTMRGHKDRVSSLHWSSHTLASGSRSGEVHIHDVRKPQHCMRQLKHHSMEVCGLQWSPDGRRLASGGNDNMVCLWNPSVGEDVTQILHSHKAAVKALAWCPWQQNLLATGGGTNDKTVKFWNTATGECQHSIDTKSQVSSVKWCKDSKELISSHGEPRNQLTIWSYPSMTKVAELKGHNERVLSMSVSPRRTRVVSAGADETLRIWKCFDVPKSCSGKSTAQDDSISTALLGGMY